ncbi:DUF2812 domain-containing protein [Aquibacillus koreensis]|uniref:DUF2812 domain-containing protein n=1 Tax=Aquibacillus koreensis TaxID=279446 RepID=A0A9X3WMR7_9BACI|nr:DUF2812 domain-containing protein [Aquibacillus koreensis]MCT2535551.1 DUF2812 domain-containing protein [Aquibacillus koreensis]MDC3420164.1 DUF2812 domain-containing protein [Aquibacillus koreensis]
MKKRVWKFFFVWQDESEEAWLSQMAEQGWIFKHYRLFYYVFEKQYPNQLLYKLDYQVNIKDFPGYVNLYKDAGWEYVTSYLGWHYFKGHKDGVYTEELYSDQNSYIQKYRRIIQTLFLALWVVVILNLPTIIHPPLEMKWILFIPAFSVILLVVAIIFVRRKIMNLTRAL